MNRVLFTIDPHGAGWMHTVTLAGALGRRGHDVLLASFGPEASPERMAAVEDSEVRLTRVEIPGPTTDPTFIATARAALDVLVKEWNPSVVHIDRCAFGDLELDVPKILMIAADRTARISRGRGPARRGLLGADAVVSPTRALSEEISRRFEYRRPISLIQPGIELGDKPVTFGPIKKAKSGFMFYGRTDDKADGFDVLLEALRRAKIEQGHPDLSFRIGGEGARPPLPGWLQDVGMLDADSRVSAFGKADIAVLPSRDDAFGLRSVEAGLSGCALVLTDVPSYHELWHGAAVLVPPDDPGALADTIRLLATDTRRREECQRLCRARALSGFSADRMIEEYLDVHRRIKRTWAKKAGGPPRLSEDVMPLS